MNPQNFTHKSQEALQHAAQIANQHGQPQIEPPHLFMALLEQHGGVVMSLFQKLDIKTDTVKAHTQKLIDTLPKQFGINPNSGFGQVMMGPTMMHILQGAVQESKKMGDTYISVEHMFLAYLTGNNPISAFLNEEGVTHNGVLEVLKNIRGNQKVDSPTPESKYQAL